LLLETDAEQIVRILPEARDLAVASRFVEPDCLGLASAGLKPQSRIPALLSCGFERHENVPRDATASELRKHEHPFDLSDAGLKIAEGSAANCLTVNAGDKEREIRIGDVLRVQAVNRYGRVALQEVCIEMLDEAAAIVRVRAIEADDNSLLVVHGTFS
jgi:hypothetical protein